MNPIVLILGLTIIVANWWFGYKAVASGDSAGWWALAMGALVGLILIWETMQ